MGGATFSYSMGWSSKYSSKLFRVHFFTFLGPFRANLLIFFRPTVCQASHLCWEKTPTTWFNSWPFFSLVGGHLTLTYISIPKRSPVELRGTDGRVFVFFWCFDLFSHWSLTGWLFHVNKKTFQNTDLFQTRPKKKRLADESYQRWT